MLAKGSLSRFETERDRLAFRQHADLPFDEAGMGAEHQHQLMFVQHDPGEAAQSGPRGATQG